MVVVSAEGEVDAFVAPDLSSTFDDLRSEPRLVLDLGRVSFMDSTALGVVVRCVRELRDDGGDVRVVLPTGTARRIFEITTLDTVLPVSTSCEDAVEELVGGGS